MLEQENNLDVLNTNEEEVVTPIEMEGAETSAKNSIEPEATVESTEIVSEISNDEVLETLPEQEPATETMETSLDENEIISKPEIIQNEPIAEENTKEKIDNGDETIPSTPEIEITASLHHEDEEEDEESKMIDEEDAINLDYSAYTKAQLLNMAIEAPKRMVAREAVKKIQNIRPFFDDLLKLERQEQLHKYLEAGNEEDTFEFKDDDSKIKFYDAFKIAQEARAEEKKRIEDEKLKNLAIKNAIIERIKVLTESDETVDSLTEIKQLQNDWKAIRVIPKPNLQELYDRYHFYLDKFYDNFAINRELKDLDRQKNLGIKIDLCNKVSALQNESSLKRAFIMLAKYQEEFKNTGPVPKEFSEEIWSRFKSTIDEVYKQFKSQFDELQLKREENLKLKEVLVEKARLIVNHIPTKVADWKNNYDDLNKLMEEWKTIGQVPKAQNETIWNAFREQFNIFSKNRSDQFKKLNSVRKNNILLRENLCKRAEELKDNEDLNFTTKEFIKLQEEWKTIGPVPESVSNVLWKRFRKACDEFFTRKQAYFDSRKGVETENLEKKQAILTEMETLQNSEVGDNVLNVLKDIQTRWNDVGFVPLKNKKDIGDKYHNLLDILYKKFRQNKDIYKRVHMNVHYNQIANQPGGDRKLGDDERKLREKIKTLKSEIETWENNIEFFAKSKNADQFRKDIELKIAKANGHIENLNRDLEALRSAKVEKV